MLVLSRKVDEKVLIGDDIEIQVVSIGRNVVKLGITAPRNLAIIRPDAKFTGPKPSADSAEAQLVGVSAD